MGLASRIVCGSESKPYGWGEVEVKGRGASRTLKGLDSSTNRSLVLREINMRGIISVCAGAFSLSSLAIADYVDVSFLGTGSGQTVKITSPSRTGSLFAGQLRHQLSNGPAGFNGDWITYCTDLAQTVSGSTSQFELVAVDQLPDRGGMGAAKAQAIQDMYTFAAGSQLSNSTSNDLATAFQLAIWEVVSDFDAGGVANNLSMTAGFFTATMNNGAALSAGISAHISALFAAIGANSASDLVGIRSGTRQDQLLQVIPGPGALALAGLGMAVAGRRRRA